MNELPARKSGRPWSLRNRLFALATMAVAVAWMVGGAVAYFAVSDESSTLFDERVRELARVVLSYAHLEIHARRGDGRDPAQFEPVASSGSHYRFQIWSGERQLLLRSADTPLEPMAPLERLGFATGFVDGEEVRTYVGLSDDGGEFIIVAEPMHHRHSFIGSFHTRFLPLILSTLFLLLGMTWWMFHRATRALGESARQIVDRSPSDLRPIEIGSPPEELRPLLESTNDLLVRFGRALDSERRLTASAAHELRTPLAALKIQAQVALRARSHEERTGALHNLGLCVDRASRMLDQLLTLARLEAMSEPTYPGVEMSLDAVTTGVLQDLAPLLKKQRVCLSTALAPAQMKGIDFWVAVLMRNLIDNAARHSPPGSKVLVETGQDATDCFARVKDSGPGIPEVERDRVFERFHRLEDSIGDGAGIGLAIVRAVVEVHHGRIQLLDSELGGLCVCVRFPKEVSPTFSVGKSPIRLAEKLSSF